MTAKKQPAVQLPPPIVELFARYGAVLKCAWTARNELAGPRRLADEKAFLPAVLALQEQPPHPAPRRVAIVICSLFVLVLGWAAIGELDIVAVAQGRVVVSARTKTIQPLEASVVKAIHVQDGDKVQAGQLLVELDSTVTRADSSRVAHEQEAAASDLVRAQALLRSLAHSGEPSLPVSMANSAQLQMQMQAEWQDIRTKLAKLDAEIVRRKAEIATAVSLVTKLQTTLPMAQARERDFKDLSSQGFVAEHTGQDRTRERIELERDLAMAQARQSEAQAGLKESEQSLAAYRAETQRNLRERESLALLKRGQLSEESVKALRRDALTRLTAPMAGTVQQLSVHTPGGVVTPAQVLLILVPDDPEVTAEVLLENKDVGFVREGQAVEIKLDTFPFTRYGTVPGNIRSISADAVQDEKRGAIFAATVVLARTSLAVEDKQIRLTPGMNLSAEIKTGKRRVIDYILSPIKQRTGESLRER